MDNQGDVGRAAVGWFGAFMSGKPLWAFMIVHTAFAGLGFGLLYTAMYLLGLRWWGAAITIMAIGAIWGFAAYRVNRAAIA